MKKSHELLKGLGESFYTLNRTELNIISLLIFIAFPMLAIFLMILIYRVQKLNKKPLMTLMHGGRDIKVKEEEQSMETLIDRGKASNPMTLNLAME